MPAPITQDRNPGCGHNESRAPTLLVVIGILGEARGRDPRSRSGKRDAVESCCTNQYDRAKPRRWHLQFRMDLGIAVDTQRYGISGRSDCVSAYNARGNRCRPGVPSFGKMRPRKSARRRPSSFKTANPWLTSHGAPPLLTPAIVIPGFEPTIGDKKAISSAMVPTANRLETKHDKITATAALVFIL